MKAIIRTWELKEEDTNNYVEEQVAVRCTTEKHALEEQWESINTVLRESKVEEQEIKETR